MEAIFKKLSALSATTILLILSAIFVVLFIYAKPAVQKYGIHFLVDPRWDVSVSLNKNSANKTPNNVNKNISDNALNPAPIGENDADVLAALGETNTQSSNNTETIYGGLVPIVGTIFSTILAMFFAVPIAMGISIFLAEIAGPKLSKPVGIAIELLAAIPSIIYGMWGLFYFGPFVSHIFGGSSVSLLVAGLVLGIMIIPFMSSLTRDSMNTTPEVLKESAYAMGATKFEVIKDVIFPYAKQGIIGSMILALGRALGETMAVAFVIGGVFTFPKKIIDPTVSIPVVLANNFAESSGMSLSALFYLALILFVLSFIVISFAKFYFLRDKK